MVIKICIFLQRGLRSVLCQHFLHEKNGRINSPQQCQIANEISKNSQSTSTWRVHVELQWAARPFEVKLNYDTISQRLKSHYDYLNFSQKLLILIVLTVRCIDYLDFHSEAIFQPSIKTCSINRMIHNMFYYCINFEL